MLLAKRNVSDITTSKTGLTSYGVDKLSIWLNSSRFKRLNENGLTTCCPQMFWQVFVFLKYPFGKILPHQKLAMYLMG